MILLCFIGIVVVYHLLGYIGHYGYDDLSYAKLSNDLKNGVIDYDDHFSFRFPILALTAVSYSIFGISDFASAFPSMLMVTLILIVVYLLLKDKGNAALTIGLSFALLSNWFIFYSDKLMPDVYVALSVLFSLYIIHRYKYDNKKHRIIIFSVLLSLSLLFGFMSKGTIVLILPLLAFYAISDLLKKQHVKFWLCTMAIGFVTFLSYFLIIWALTGSFFKRFESIANNSYLNLCSYSEQPFKILLKRITIDFFELTVYHGIAIGFVFVIAYLLKHRKTHLFKIKDSFSFWLTSALVLVLSANFMSISFTVYSPMCLDPRHYLFLLPVVSIPASLIIKEYIEKKELSGSIIFSMLVIVIIDFFLPGNNFYLLYLPLLVLIVLFQFIKIKPLFQRLFVLVFVVILALNAVSVIRYAQKVNYRKQKEIFIENILNREEHSIVITNEIQKRLGDYYNGFKKNGKCTVVDFNEFKYDSTETRKTLLFLNPYTRSLSGLDKHDLPYYAKNISEKNKLIFKDEELNIEIYEMINFAIPELTGKLLLSSKNDFEIQPAFWSENERSKSEKFKGNYSNRVKEYSSTFLYQIDALDLNGINQLYIRCEAFCNYSDKTNSSIVISIEDNNGAYIWDAVEINKYLKAYSNWWPVKHELAINLKEIKKNSSIKIYLWNADKKKAFVDDFKVEVFGNSY